MPMYITFDGGGTKTHAILFDESGPLAQGKSGGTNTTFTTQEDCRSNIANCLDQVLAGIARPKLAVAYGVLVGPWTVFEEELRRRAAVSAFVQMGEGEAGLLAGVLQPYGLLALSGTGSDVFYRGDDGAEQAIGGFGAILGDDGSGVWIGQQALRKAIAYAEGWGEPTLLKALIFERWGITKNFDIVSAVHGEVAPYRKVASVVPLVAEAARAKDAVARAIFEEAGRLMAVQALALVKNRAIPAAARICTCCGGAWKAHPLMYDTFAAAMAQNAREITTRKPAFEHVMAGVVRQRRAGGAAIPPQRIYDDLAKPYAQFRITW